MHYNEEGTVRAMKAIQRKIITLLVWCTFFVVLAVEFVGLSIMNRALDKDATQIMTFLCEEKAGELNEYLHSVEQSVDTMHQMAMDGLQEYGENLIVDASDTEAEKVRKAENLEKYLYEIKEISRILADNTAGAIAVYYRFNPKLFEPTAGFFSVKIGNEEFINYQTTDLSLYKENDEEHVFWYYEPVNAGKAVWLDPYPNDNIGVEMISYVAPVFYNGETIGVVGMDIDIVSWREKVEKISLYETGFAALLDRGGDVVYHPDYPDGLTAEEKPVIVESMNYYISESLKREDSYDYELDAQERVMVAKQLDNGMNFVVVVPFREISAPSRLLMVETMILTIGIVIVFSMFSVRICKRIISIAYTDVMTGARNKTAYEEAVEMINQEIRNKAAKFSLIMFDINNLKPTNDTYGHDQGDRLIIAAANLIQQVFGKKNVYRIGGDEFLVLLCHEEAGSTFEQLAEFDQQLDRLNKKERFVWGDIRIARGVTIYNYNTDAVYGDVFRRADALMYENKKKQKEQE